jgi:hypothetical protein
VRLIDKEVVGVDPGTGHRTEVVVLVKVRRVVKPVVEKPHVDTVVLGKRMINPREDFVEVLRDRL